MRLIRPTAAVFALALAAGCATIPIPGFEQVRGPDLERKPVTGKKEPTLLVADDGSRCNTTRERWERARTGQRVWCVWVGGTADEARGVATSR